MDKDMVNAMGKRNAQLMGKHATGIHVERNIGIGSCNVCSGKLDIVSAQLGATVIRLCHSCFLTFSAKAHEVFCSDYDKRRR